MAKKKYLLGVLAIALALGVAVAGCNKSSQSSGGGTTAGIPGTLKITGLPEQNWAVYLFGTNIDLSSLTNISSAENSLEAFGRRLSSGETSFTLINYAGTLWTATGKRQVILVNQDHNKENPANKNNPLARIATVNFPTEAQRLILAVLPP